MNDLAERYTGGASINSLACEYGLSAPEVENRLRALGLSIRESEEVMVGGEVLDRADIMARFTDIIAFAKAYRLAVVDAFRLLRQINVTLSPNANGRLLSGQYIFLRLDRDGFHEERVMVSAGRGLDYRAAKWRDLSWWERMNGQWILRTELTEVEANMPRQTFHA